jgi:hypothetical protein
MDKFHKTTISDETNRLHIYNNFKWINLRRFGFPKYNKLDDFCSQLKNGNITLKFSQFQ